MKKEIIVIGSGPAGLFGAIQCARSGAHVTVLEGLPSPGRKLLASGAGKCNLTNILPPDAMTMRFPAAQRRFIRPALYDFSQQDLRAFFASADVPCKLVNGFHYFPVSERAGDILAVLVGQLEALGGVIVCSSPVIRLEYSGDRITAVTTAAHSHPCDGVLAAGGSPAHPALGGRGSLYKVLAAAGHTVVAPVPALSGLPVEHLPCGDLAGMILPRVQISLDRRNVTEDILLFTHEGISGPAVLDLSGRVSRRVAAGEKVKLQLNLLPERSLADWEAFWLEKRRSDGAKLVKNLLAGSLPRALAEHLAVLADCADTPLHQFRAEQKTRLNALLTAWELAVSRLPPWEGAMAAAGGVARDEVEPGTLRSRIFGNLAFAGEILDVDGPCGGYNLQWAFSSGRLAGKTLARA